MKTSKKEKAPKYQVGESLHFRTLDGQIVPCRILLIRKFLWWYQYLIQYETLNHSFTTYITTDTKWMREGRLI